jgi:O-antigen/teichoic acid export membrane protein
MGLAMNPVARDFLIYGLSAGLGRAVGLITLPILSRVLTPAEYGVVAYVTTISSLLLLIAAFGNEQTLARFMTGTRGETDARRLASTWLLFLLLGHTLLVALAGWLLMGSPSLPGCAAADCGYMLFLAVAALPFLALNAACGQIVRLRFQPYRYAALALIGTALTAGLVIVAVVVLRLGVAGVLWGALVSSAAVLPLALALSGQWRWQGIDRSGLEAMLAYGWPLALSGAVYWALNSIDRLALALLSDGAELGRFSVAQSLIGVLVFVFQAFAFAWQPRILDAYRREPAAAPFYAAKLAPLYLYGSGLLAVALAVTARPVIGILAGSAFADAWLAVPPLAFGMFCFGSLPFASLGIMISGRTGHGLAAAMVGTGVVVVLAWLLVPRFTIVGAGIATACGYLTVSLCTYAASQRAWPIPLSRRAAAALIGLVAVACAASFLTPPGLVAASLFGIAVLATYAMLGFLVGRVLCGWSLQQLIAAAQGKPLASA